MLQIVPRFEFGTVPIDKLRIKDVQGFVAVQGRNIYVLGTMTNGYHRWFDITGEVPLDSPPDNNRFLGFLNLMDALEFILSDPDRKLFEIDSIKDLIPIVEEVTRYDD